MYDPKSERIYDGIITKFLDTGVVVYVEELDIIHPVYIMSKLSDMIDIIQEETVIQLIHKRTGSIINLNLLQKVKIKVLITPYESNLNKKIRFYLEKPNLIELIL